jgi:succinyl-CoA:acetate CoA-transferase
VGNNKTWLDQADAIILEVNTRQNPALEGMHDIYYGTELPPYRIPIPLLQCRATASASPTCAATRTR